MLRGVFADDGLEVVQERAVSVARADDQTVVVRTASGQEVTGERLLVATGRFADTGDLGLDQAGVQTDERGFVVVDAHQRTSNPRVFAAGDVSGAPQYVYVAARAGHAAAAAAAHALGDPTTVGYRGLPGVTFTTPQLASAGLTEQQALARGHRCDCRVLGGQDIPRALANRTPAARSSSSSTPTPGRSSACTPRSTAPATSCSPPPTRSSTGSPSTTSPTPGRPTSR